MRHGGPDGHGQGLLQGGGGLFEQRIGFEGVVTEALDHASVGITLDTYSHLLPGMQAEAAAKIDGALGADMP